MTVNDAGSEVVASPPKGEFDDFLIRAKSDPARRAQFEDLEELHRVIDTLVHLRRKLSLSQSTVAQRMGVRQPAVSGFETEGSNPRLSTLQRYARAVGARFRLVVEVPRTCDWVTDENHSYRERGLSVSPGSNKESSSLARSWRPSETPGTRRPAKIAS